MKIYINAYLAENLGDDLFIKILTEKYPNHKFYSISRGFKNYTKNNLKVYSNTYIFRVLKKFQLEKYLANRYDLVVSIGGSMYIENNDSKRDFSLGKNKYYVLGSNFGPYKTQEYFNNIHNFFEKAEDVVFREKYSYELFKDLPNVRYASDIVFNLNTEKIKNTNRKKVIFSIISCKYKMGIEYQKQYEEKMIEMIKYFNQNGYEICLMSFCKAEDDEEAIEEIIKKCTDDLKQKIEKYYYRGNVEEALDIIGDASVMVGSRFHANIVALLLGKKVIPVLYSDKTKHVIEDLKLDLEMIDIRNIKDFHAEKLTGILSNDQEKNKAKIINAIEGSKKQFEKLDEVLGKEK